MPNEPTRHNVGTVRPKGKRMKPQSIARTRLRYSPGVPSLSGAILALVLSTGPAWAQTLPPGALEQIDHVVGSRVETFAVLDTQSGASGGTYASKVNDTDLSITRVTGTRRRGRQAAARGHRNPVESRCSKGASATRRSRTTSTTGALDGNKSTVTSLAAFLGGGVRFTVWDDWSLDADLRRHLRTHRE